MSAFVGGTQKHVLTVLSDGIPRTAMDWAAWYPLSLDAVRSAISRLERRGFVDVAGRDGLARTYTLTKRGRKLAGAVFEGDD